MEILWLNSRETIDPKELGSKAAGLANLHSLGFQIPHGFVISTSTFQEFLNSAGLAPALSELAICSDPDAWQIHLDEINHGLSTAIWPPQMQSTIINAYQTLPGRVAVRSSGISEDTEASSFAGGYASFLNRSGEESVLTSIRECWKSGFSDKVVAYRRQHGIIDTPWLLAVIVQSMVDADKAGVLFTRNPFDDDDSLLLEAVTGGCDRLVAGEPAELSVWVDRSSKRTTRIEQNDPPPRAFGAVKTLLHHGSQLRTPRLLRPGEITSLVTIGLRVEKAFGTPQDIEWAIAANTIILLQSRPLTAYLPSVERR